MRKFLSRVKQVAIQTARVVLPVAVGAHFGHSFYVALMGFGMLGGPALAIGVSLACLVALGVFLISFDMQGQNHLARVMV